MTMCTSRLLLLLAVLGPGFVSIADAQPATPATMPEANPILTESSLPLLYPHFDRVRN